MPDHAGPPKVVVTYPDLNLPWPEMSQAVHDTIAIDAVATSME